MVDLARTIRYLRVVGLDVQGDGGGRMRRTFRPEDEEKFLQMSRQPNIYDRICRRYVCRRRGHARARACFCVRALLLVTPLMQVAHRVYFAYSISPSISGSYTHDIKKAVACLLFGGSRKILPGTYVAGRTHRHSWFACQGGAKGRTTVDPPVFDLKRFFACRQME